MRDMLAGRRDNYVAEKRYLRPNGDVVWARIASTLLRDRRAARPITSSP